MRQSLSSFLLRFIVVVSFTILLIFSVPSSRSYSPTWLKQGTYAKYGALPVVFRWECLGIEGSTAKLDISLFSNETVWKPTGGWTGENLHLSTVVNVDMETRDVTLLNGSAFGKTLLWLPANPKNGETININGANAVIGVSGAIPPPTRSTPQGAQRAFTVTNWDVEFAGAYDLDTGVRISGFSDDDWVYEGTIKALGLKNRWIFMLDLSDTNIDLGPRELWPEIGRYFVFLPFVAVAIIVPVFLLRRRQKHARIAKRLKNRKTASTRTFS